MISKVSIIKISILVLFLLLVILIWAELNDGIILEETGSIFTSDNKNLWLNSGGQLFLKGSIMKTLQNDLPINSRWRISYLKSNPEDSKNGYRPQNIFRLITKREWKDFRQEVYFKILKYDTSNSTHRDISNGILLLNRYQDSNNLYYAGIRVDGTAIIKKKINGEYYTLAQNKIFEGEYDRDKNPILLPFNKWMGIRTEIKNFNNSYVKIKLLLDRNNDGYWELVLETNDNGINYGGPAFLSNSHTGIRSDFMDLEFKNYKTSEINK